MFGTRMLTACVVCFLAMSVVAAELPQPLVEWDLARTDLWDAQAGSIANSGSLTAGPLTIQEGLPYGAMTASDVGMPQFYTDGGSFDGERPYIALEKFSSVLGTNSASAGIFLSSSAIGYTQVGYYYISKDMRAQVNAGIGGKHYTNWQNEFLYSLGIEQGGNGSVTSWTAMRTPGDVWWEQQDSLMDGQGNSIVPRDRWFQFVKVVDIVNNEFRYYVDGELALTTYPTWGGAPINLAAGDYRFYGNDDLLGAIGTGPDRLVKGVGFSYFAGYDCVLTDEQIKASHAYLTGVPEPATMSLLALGGLALLRRRA